MVSSRLSALFLSAAVAFLSSGCGGGGGDAPTPTPPPPEQPPGNNPPPPPPPPAEGWTLGGTISISPTAAVDSDTNDADQAGRKDNGDFPVAQALSTPVQLTGSVNKPGEGPAGPNHDAGDEIDGYRVTLKAGQVVELEFAADPSVNDLDLFVFDGQTQQTVGQSSGSDNRYECVRISKDGDYFLAVNAYAGASIYNLRIGAPGSAGSCANATTALGAFLPGQIIAKASAHGAATAKTKRAQLMATAGLTGNGVPDGAPELLRASASATSRAAGLRRLAAASGHTLKMAALQPRAPALQQALDTVRYVKQLRATGLYDYVEFNRLRQKQTLVGSFPPNDPYYVNQRWHYEMINLPSAMERLVALAPQPVQRPIVAVIDSGIVADHPDLQPQVVEGRTFFTMTAGGDHNSGAYDDDTPAGPEADFHGTHVSGTVAALTFEGKGAAGVAPMAQLMPLRVFTPLREGATDYDIANAALFAAGLPNSSGRLPARKADVINLSVGGVGNCAASYSDTIARVRAQGVLFVVAAGNEASNDAGRSAPVTSPGNCPGVIAVSALNASQRLSYYSSSGAEVKVAAPGGDMRQSTTGNGLSDGIFSTVGTFDHNGNRVPTYAMLQGTSMASPHVAGVMALMRWANPDITPDQVDTLFAQGKLTDDIGPAGRDTAYGWGVIDARKAVDAALELRGVNPPPAAGSVVASPSSLDFGSFQSSAEIELMLTAAGSEKVTGVTSDSDAVTLHPIDADGTTGLGRYRVEVDRSKLAEGTSFPKLTVQTTTRQFTVQLTVVKPVAGETDSHADYGRVYVLVIDDATGQVAKQANVNAANGRYSWQVSGVTLPKVRIVAGTDLDNDGYLCQRGEACGAYPLLSDSGAAAVSLSASRSDLDFQIAPFGGVNTSGAGGGIGRSTPWQRLLPAERTSAPNR